jgi:hypothetical protein
MFILLLLAAPAQAAGLFINGVPADGVRNTAFHNCDVRIDEHGNVHISAKGYVVSAVGDAAPRASGAAPEAVPATLSRRYYLVALAGRPGEAQWEIDVFINAKFVRKVTGREPQTLLEVTKYLQVGRNHVHIQATKHLGAYGRRSSSPQAYVEIVVGEGNQASGALLVNNPIVRYRKTAAEMGSEVRDFTLVAQ